MIAAVAESKLGRKTRAHSGTTKINPDEMKMANNTVIEMFNYNNTALSGKYACWNRRSVFYNGHRVRTLSTINPYFITYLALNWVTPWMATEGGFNIP